RWPSRERSRPYTSRSRESPGAVNDWPPVARASSWSVCGLGGTWMTSVYPPVSVWRTTPKGVPRTIVYTGMRSALALLAAACGEILPPSLAPSETTSTAVGGMTPSLVRCRLATCAHSATASPRAVPRHGQRRPAGEGDHADSERLRHLVQERLRCADGGGEPRRSHVGRAHRPRHVDGEHDRRLPARDGDVGVRAGDADDHGGQPGDEERDRQVAAPTGGAVDDVGEQGRVREARREA